MGWVIAYVIIGAIYDYYICRNRKRQPRLAVRTTVIVGWLPLTLWFFHRAAKRR